MKSLRPNLFVIGAMKSGTTTLHEYLGTHPEIYMCEKKEPAYFVEEYGWSNGEDWYLRLFARASNVRFLGESTTDYTKMPRFEGVAKRIAEFNPDARFIYLLRDPVERTISHYWWRVRFHGESRPMLQALREEPYYRAVSNYAYQLKPYLDLFDREQFQIVIFERMVADPQAACSEIFSWLGVDPSHRLPSSDVKKRSTPEVVEQVRGRGLAQKFRYSRTWSLLGPRVPAFVKSLGKRVAIREISPKRTVPDGLLKWLREIQVNQVEELSEMVGMSFPEWRTLYATPNEQDVVVG